MLKKTCYATTTAVALMAGTAAHANISVCISVSATGPGAALGISQQNTVQLLPTEFEGQGVSYTVYDDETDPTAATQNARKCVNERAADLIIGGSTAPTAVAISTVASETGTPFLAVGPFPLQPEHKAWSFIVSQPFGVMMDAVVQDIAARGISSLGYIGYNDALSDITLGALEPRLAELGIEISPSERFARTDTTVTAQILRISSANPDAVMVAASAAPAAAPNLALEERGYAGVIYHTHGSATQSFLDVAGASAEGTLLPVGLLTVAADLPDDNPSKAVGMAYIEAYEAIHGSGTAAGFGSYVLDAWLVVEAALPDALSAAAPGTADFRTALRDALERTDGVVGAQGTYYGSEDEHELSNNDSTRVLAVVSEGRFRLAATVQE